MFLYVDDIPMLYPKDTTRAVMVVKARLSEKYKSTNLGPPRQFLGIEIHCEETEPAPGSVLAGEPSSPQFSNDLPCRMLTMYQLQWIPM